MRIDVNAFVGHYPFRPVPGGSPGALLEAMDRNGIEQAWISHLAAIFWKDPAEGNQVLYRIADSEPRFRPVPSVSLELPDWDRSLREAAERGAPCVRADPTRSGMGAGSGPMLDLVHACGEAGLPLLLAVRLEDVRQRHPGDRATDLDPASLRALVRTHPAARLIVTHADRETIEQVHFGSTPGEAARILWDVSWIWGPPEDHLELLLGTVGIERFVFGTGMPLRIAENSVAKLDLLELTPADRERIESGNLTAFGIR